MCVCPFLIAVTHTHTQVARYLAEICEIEMVGRAVKALLRKLISQHPAIAQAPAPVLAALFNFLLASDETLPLSAQALYPLKQVGPSIRLSVSRCLSVSLSRCRPCKHTTHTFVYTCVSIYVCIYICVHVCMYVYTTHTFVYTCVSICTYVCTYVYTAVCMRGYLYICIQYFTSHRRPVESIV
jgi:hypothetical protein